MAIKLEKLTPKQESLIPQIVKKWTSKLFDDKIPVNHKLATKQIEWLYSFSKLKKPIIIFLDSPFAGQIGANYLKLIFKNMNQVRDQVWDQVNNQIWNQVRNQVRDQVWDQVRDQVWDQVRDQVWGQIWNQVNNQVGGQVLSQIRDQVWDQVRDQVWGQIWNQVNNQVGGQVLSQIRSQVNNQVGDQVGDQVRDQVGEQVWNQVRDQVGNQVGDQVGDQVRDQDFNWSRYGNIWDYGWCSFYDYFKQIGINVNNKGLEQFISLLNSGVYDMIQLNGVCIVCNKPIKIYRDETNRLHSDKESAIEWSDGYKLWFYHGINIPENWVENKEKITSDEIKKESNAEKRRALRNLLGMEKYYEKLGGVNEIDRDVDNQGNEMILYESKKDDSVVNKKIQYLEVICPSTKRKYVLYPTKKCNNVWEAKSSTFQDRPIKYRHGDCSLEEIGKIFKNPIYET